MPKTIATENSVEEQSQTTTTNTTTRFATEKAILEAIEQYDFGDRELRLVLALYQHGVMSSEQLAKFCFSPIGFDSLGEWQLPDGGYGKEYLRKTVSKLCSRLYEAQFINYQWIPGGKIEGKAWYITRFGVKYLKVMFQHLVRLYQDEYGLNEHEESLLAALDTRYGRIETAVANLISGKIKFSYHEISEEQITRNLQHNICTNDFVIELMTTLIKQHPTKTTKLSSGETRTISARVVWQPLQQSRYRLTGAMDSKEDRYLVPDAYVSLQLISVKNSISVTSSSSASDNQVDMGLFDTTPTISPKAVIELNRLDYFVEYDRATTRIISLKKNRFGRKILKYALLYEHKQEWAEAWRETNANKGGRFPIVLVVTEGKLKHARNLIAETERQLRQFNKLGKLDWLFTRTEQVEAVLANPEKYQGGVMEAIWFGSGNQTSWVAKPETSTNKNYQLVRLPRLVIKEQ